jgi:type II secretory pathway pseudopilin PulG
MAQLKASTLVESTIALSMISIVFTIAWMMIGMLIQSNKSLLKQKASIAAKSIMQEHIAQENYLETTIEREQFIINQSVEVSDWCSECLELHLKAYDDRDHLLVHHKQLIYAN